MDVQVNGGQEHVFVKLEYVQVNGGEVAEDLTVCEINLILIIRTFVLMCSRKSVNCAFP